MYDIPDTPPPPPPPPCIIEEPLEIPHLKTYQAKKALEIFMENIQVFDKKQEDYGPYNICGNPHPELGVAFRSGDKVNRLMNLFLKTQGEPNNESVLDSWIDLANYGIIGQMLHKGVWLEPNQ